MTALAALLALQAAAVAAAVPTFVVDLDAPPEERWREVIAHYRDSGVLAGMHAATKQTASRLAPADRRAWLEAIRPQVDEGYLAEARSWVKLGAVRGLSLDDVLILAFGYEMNYPLYCSGLVAAMPNGTVVHGRNMDYSLLFEVNGTTLGWPDVTADVTFMRGGAPLMTSVTWPFQLGIHTAMRFNGWSFQQNTRRLGNDMRLNLAAAQRGSRGFGLLARRLMERVPDFESAVAELSSANFISPQYFVLAGPRPYEGAVVTIDRGGHREPSTPLVARFAAGQGAWHLLQTNDDRNKVPADIRRPLELWKLSERRQAEVSAGWVFEQMHGKPLNNDFTVFTWVAVPATGAHWTLLPGETLLASGTVAPASATFRALPQRSSFLARPIARH